ncbi:tetratricopeptide repeat protein [Collimonas sp. NPDC087041]|uniref:tetratricopeptide repeat protein n=1 Tax=Collimonas sp. NPDC087041 TaxID=3363960 RepID=UPI0037F5D84E
MKKWLILLSCLLLGACASVPPPRADGLFNDQLFSAPSQPISAADVFAVSAPMRSFLASPEIVHQMHANGSQRGLFDALYSKGQLRLEYDSVQTHNAAQTFAARSGNCLSLVIMTAAFARQLGLPVRFQRVLMDESWTRNGDIYFASGHVNLTLGKKMTDADTRYDQSRLMTIDFLPPEDITGQRTADLAEATVVAMYMNNRAAETLAAGQLDDAYWWAREAIRQDPNFLSSYNTLGVIYRRHGNLREAEQALRRVYEREPNNTVVMFNLQAALKDLGRTDEAQALATRLAQLQPEAPFHYFSLGMEAMRAGDFKAAKALFTKELARDPYYHEFQFWLGIACLRLGETDEAVRHMAIALENSTTHRDHELYAAKLDRLKAQLPH